MNKQPVASLKFRMDFEGFAGIFSFRGGIQIEVHQLRGRSDELHQQVWGDFLAETSIPTAETPDRIVRGSQPARNPPIIGYEARHRDVAMLDYLPEER